MVENKNNEAGDPATKDPATKDPATKDPATKDPADQFPATKKAEELMQKFKEKEENLKKREEDLNKKMDLFDKKIAELKLSGHGIMSNDDESEDEKMIKEANKLLDGSGFDAFKKPYDAFEKKK